ncbi:MAG: translocation/assembly module TamB domain-containing protein [Rhodospirillaceae bacterium]
MTWKATLRRRTRQLLIGVAGLAALLALAAAGLWGWSGTETGRRTLTAMVAAWASEPGFRVAVGDVEGELPFRMRLHDLTVSDHKGRWLTARTTLIRLDPHALLEGRLEIGEIAVDRLEITRPPLPEPEPATAAAPPAPAVSAPPAAKAGGHRSGRGLVVAVRRLAIAELALGGALFDGEAALLHAEGTAEIGDVDAGQSVDLRFGRRDGLPGAGHLHVSYTPDTDRLDLDLAGSEPEGGLMARALGLPGLPALAFNAIGIAPLADWHGRITLAADGRSVLDLGAAVRPAPGGHRITLSGGARPMALLPAPWAGLAGPAPTLALELVTDSEGGVVLRPGSILTLAAGTIGAEGSLDGDTDRLTLRLRAEPTVEALAALISLPKDSHWKRAALEAGLVIAPGAPGPAFDLKAEVDYLTGSNPLITRLAGPHLQGSVRGQALRGGEIRLDAVTLGLAAGTLNASGSLFPREPRLAASGHLTADRLNRLLGAFGVPLNGTADLDLRLAATGDGGRLEITGRAAGFALENESADPWLRALTGDGFKVRGTLAFDASGTLRARDWSLDGARLGASGEAELIGGVLAASARVTVPRLAGLGVAGAPDLSGAAGLELRASGPLTRLEARGKLTLSDLGLDGRRLGHNELELVAGDLPARPQATMRLRALSGVAAIEALSAGAALALAADGKRLTLSELTLSQGANRVTGSAQATLEGGGLSGLTGHLDGQLPALETLTPLLGQPLRGHGRFALDLGRDNGRLTARATLDAAQLRLGGSAEAPELAAADLELKASVTAAGVAEITAGRIGGSLTLGGHRLKAGELTLAALTATLTGSSEQAGFEITAPGLDAAGTLALGSNGTLRLGLTRLTSQLGGLPMSLGQPAGLEIAPGRLAVTGLRLAGRDFRLGADGRLGPDGLKGRLDMERLPLELLHLLDAGIPAGGRVDGEIALSGSAAEPKADLSLRFKDIGQAQADAAGIGVGGLDGALTGRWLGNRLSLSGSATASHGTADLRFSGEGPLVLRLRPPGLAVPESGSLRGTVTGSVDLAALNDLMATSGDRLAGRMAVDVAVSGTAGAPQLGGSLGIADGHYENQAAGTVIDHITARLTGTGRTFTVESFSGTTGNGGTIAVTGTVRPAAGDLFDLRIRAGDARLVQLDGASIDADADLTLTGGLREARLAGSLGIRRADIRLPDQLPTEVVDLEVEEAVKPLPAGSKTRTGGKAAVPPAAATPGPVVRGSPPGRLTLALAVEAHNLVFIHGRGLDTEFGCALTIGGTAAAPEPRGQATLQRGKLDVLGKEFQVKRGLIRFPGGVGASPELDALAEAKASTITAQAELTGTVRAPRLVLSSVPAAPQDEILSRLLFDKAVSQLGALEAVQLANSAARLVGIGGSAGLVDRIRRTLGVDRLGVTSTGTANPLNPAGGKSPSKAGGKSSGLGSALEAGRYVSRDVYLGIQQGLTADSSRAKVEVGITDNIQAEVGVGVRADPQVGVKLQWDY